jgi:hypothetical protein
LFAALAFLLRPASLAPAPAPQGWPERENARKMLEWRLEQATDELHGRRKVLKELEAGPDLAGKKEAAVRMLREEEDRLIRVVAELEQHLADLEKKH